MRTSVSPRSSRVTPVSPARPLRVALLSVAAAALALAAGCSSMESSPALRRTITFFAPYRADLIQGNVVTSDQVARVKTGMNRAQVRDILGTPLVADPFHADRWDYVFLMKRQGIPEVQRRFTVHFENDEVAKIDAPDLPTEDEFVADISRRPLPTSGPKLALTDAEKAALPAPRHEAEAPAAAASATGPLRAYPPLEP